MVSYFWKKFSVNILNGNTTISYKFICLFQNYCP